MILILIPLASVLATFLFAARLDTMLTVVDASRFLEHFEVLEDLAELGVARDDEDDRTVVDLLVDQVRTLNPRAVVEIAERG